MKVSLGWVPLDTEGNPFRATRSGYRPAPLNGYHPPRVYTKEGLAQRQSPVGRAVEVFMEKDE